MFTRGASTQFKSLFCASPLILFCFTSDSIYPQSITKNRHKHDAHLSPPFTHIPEGLTLDQIVIINRHGDRSPISRKLGTVIRDDPENINFWYSRLPNPELVQELDNSFPVFPKLVPIDNGQEPFSQLTLKGAKELQEVGKKIKSFFVDQVHFLPSTPIASQIYARATNIRRTERSAQNLLLGIYPINHATDKNIDQIRINIREEAKETLFPNSDGLCFRQNEIIHSFLENGIVEQYPGLEDLKKRLIHTLGVDEYIKWTEAREVLTCFLIHELELPNGVSNQLINDIINYTSWMWGKWFSNTELVRLAIGRFIEEMVKMMHDKISNKNDYKLLIFSGHDSTIIPILCCLGIYDNSWPPYSSYIMFQIAKDKNESRFIQVLYNDEPMKMFGSSEQWIPFQQFLNETKKFIPTDYVSECQLSPNEKVSCQTEIANTIR